jgi:hypothetical protein
MNRINGILLHNQQAGQYYSSERKRSKWNFSVYIKNKESSKNLRKLKEFL